MPYLPTLTPWNFARRIVLPEPGEELLIELRGDDVTEGGRMYHARLKSVGLRRLVADQVHASQGSAIPPFKSMPAAVSFARDSALYQFETRIETCHAPGTNHVLLSLGRPKRVERVQRRSAYRVTVETRTTYRPLGSSSGREEMHTGQIVNLSEGGVLLASAAPIPRGQRIVIRVPAEREGSPMDVMAVSIESRTASSTRGLGCLTRLRFDDQDQVQLSETQRGAILRYVFEQQRLMLQTRRLLTSSSRTRS